MCTGVLSELASRSPRETASGSIRASPVDTQAMAVEFATAQAGGKGDDAPARTNREEEEGERTTRARPSTTTTESSRDGREKRRPGALGAAARPRPQALAADYPAAGTQRSSTGSKKKDR